MEEGAFESVLMDLWVFSGQEGRGCPERVRGHSDGKGLLGVGDGGRSEGQR